MEQPRDSGQVGRTVSVPGQLGRIILVSRYVQVFVASDPSINISILGSKLVAFLASKKSEDNLTKV